MDSFLTTSRYGRVRLIDLRRYPAAFGQFVHAGQHHLITGLDSVTDLRFIAICWARIDVADGYSRIGTYEKYVSVRPVALYRCRGNKDHTPLLFEQEAGVNELVREQSVIC